MTEYVGYLLFDCSDPRSIFQERLWCDYSPYGALAPVLGWPKEDASPSQKKEFIDEAISQYDRLRRKGCQDIAMAMTLDSGAFEGFEMMYMDKEASPKSFDDWLALKEIYKENGRRDAAYWDKHGSARGKIVGLLRGKKYRASVRPKGVLAVARIRKDLEENSRDEGYL